MSLIAHYKLDGNADDSSGNGNHGTASNVVWGGGVIKEAALFNGNTSYVDTLLPNTLMRGNLSVSMWVYFNDETRGLLFGNYDGTSNSFNLERHTSNRLRVYYRASPDYFSQNNSVITGQWNHIVFIRDLSKGAWEIYAGAVLVGSIADVGVWVNGGLPGFLLGRDSRTGETALNGKIDDVRIYDHAISQKDIKDLSRAKIAHYKLDCAGSIADSANNLPAATNNNAVFSSASSPVGLGSHYFSAANLTKPVIIPFGLGHSVANGLTLSFRVKADALLENQMFAAFGTNTDNRRAYFSIYQGKWDMGVRAVGFGGSVYPATTQWTHILIVFNGSSATMYANLQPVITIAYSAYDLLENLTIGSYGDGTYQFKGLIADVRIYTSSIGLSEMQELFSQRASISNQGQLFSNSFSENLFDHVFSDLSGWVSFGQSFGSISLSGGSCTISNSTGTSLDVMGVYSSHLVNVGEKVTAVVRHTAGRHSSVLGLASAGYFPYPHAAEALTTIGVSLYSRADAITATISGRESSVLTQTATVDVNQDDFRQFNVLEIHRVSASLHTFYKNGVYLGQITLNISGSLSVFFSADGHTKPNTLEVQSVKVSAITPSVQHTGVIKAEEVSEVGIMNGCVAYYPLNKNVKDFSGSGYHGTNNGADLVGGGHDGQGAHRFFRTQADWVNLPFFNLFDGIKDFTVLIWAKVSGLGGTQPDDVIFNPLREGYFAIMASPDGYTVRYYSAAPVDLSLSVSMPGQFGEWVMLTMSLSGTTLNGYLNGVKGSPVVISGVPYKRAETINYLGKDYWAGQREIDGDLSGLKIFNRALLDEEVTIEYKRGLKVLQMSKNTVYATELVEV